MDYVIKRSNGDVYANIPANVVIGPNINVPTLNPTPINLIGRNRISYGQPQNENFLWLTENFASFTAPTSTVVGQLWYKAKQQNGQLLLSVVDNARNPVSTDPSTESDWGVIPLITMQNNLPSPDESLMGRMALTNNGDALKVVMKNKEWREIQTVRPVDKQYEKLLDIEYDTGKKYISFTSGAPTKSVAYFNAGGAMNPLENGYYDYKDGEGSLRYGSTYFFEIRVIGRRVDVVNGQPVARPQTFKTWQLLGSFYVDNKGNVNVTSLKPSQIPDPRRLLGVTNCTNILTDNGVDTDTWNITLMANGVDTALSSLDISTADGFRKYITASLNSNKHLGLKLQATIGGIPAGQTIYTQWSVLLQMTGIPPLGV